MNEFTKHEQRQIKFIGEIIEDIGSLTEEKHNYLLLLLCDKCQERVKEINKVLQSKHNVKEMEK